MSEPAPMSAAELRTRQVDPSAIEHELSALWMAEAEARQQAQTPMVPLARTLLLSLVIFAPDRAAAERARSLAVGLTRRQPLRSIILVAGDRSAAEGLEAWVSIQCESPLHADEQVCGEHIVLEAQGASSLDLPGLVLPLLLPNVPSFLWWQQGNPFTHPILAHLNPAVDRLIVDSLTFATPLADFFDVARALPDPYFPAIVSDLSWARLAPWRYLTAHIFDPEATRPYLDSLDLVRLSYVTGSPVLAWLFGGWLASRLKWQPAEFDVLRVRFAGGQVIEFSAIPMGEAAPGDFAGVQLMGRDGATFEVMRAPNACAVIRLDAGGLHTERMLPLRDERLSEWLGHELNRLHPSPTYEAAVRLIGEAASRASADGGLPEG